jgi:hypothetical protein
LDYLFTTTIDLTSFPCTEQFRVWALDLLAGCYSYWHGAGGPDRTTRAYRFSLSLAA